MSDTPAPAAKRRGPSILLIVSLCLNIALVPVIAAVVLRALHRDTEIGSGSILAPRSVMASLPDERAAIQKIIDRHTAAIRRLRHDSAQTRLDAFQIFASPSYTPQSLAAALDRVHVADAALEAESVAMMGESLAVLTPDERRAMVEKVRRRNRSWLFRLFRPRPARD